MMYRIVAALHGESKEGWVWISPAEDRTATHIRVLNPEGGRSVVCEQRVIDDNFVRVYEHEVGRTLPLDSPVLVISEYYRDQLGGFPTNILKKLEVTPERGWFSTSFTAPRSHPSAAVRSATGLGILSIVLALAFGALSVALGLIALLR